MIAELNIYAGTPESPRRPGDLAIVEAPQRNVCTPSDPFGLGKEGHRLSAASPHSRSEADERARADRSAQDFGMVMYGPLYEAVRLRMMFSKLGGVCEVLDTIYTLGTRGPDEALKGYFIADAIDRAVDQTTKKFPILAPAALLLKNTLNKVVEVGGGRLKAAWDDSGRREPRWTLRANQVQTAVDRGEQREREAPGDMIA